MKVLKLENLKAEAGKKVSGFVRVPETDIQLPVTLISGKNEGNTILISGGYHNAEYVGIETAIELADELNPEFIIGNVIVIHVINTSGFERRTMSVVYEDEKNLNQAFPGNKNGTVADKIAFFIEEVFHSKADYYIDLHSGDGYEELVPYTYFSAAAEPNVAKKSREMAERTAVNYHVGSMFLKGGSFNCASAKGVPSILLERGCQGKWSQEEVNACKNDVKNVMRYLNILVDLEPCIIYNAKTFLNTHYIKASYTGCWYPNFHAGDWIKKGDCLGVVKDYFGNALESCIAKSDGMILYQTSSLNVLKHGAMIAYGEVADA